MRARFLLSEVRIGLRRNLTMTFAVVVTTAISLSLLGIGRHSCCLCWPEPLDI